MLTTRIRLLPLATMPFAFLMACTSQVEPGASVGTGGSSSSMGGQAGQSGQSGTGGTGGTTGAVATGGSGGPGTGGANGGAGRAGTAGAPGSGGSGATGGASNTGTGGASNTGGASGSAGRAGSGGAAGGGGRVGTAGATGAGGTIGTGGAAGVAGTTSGPIGWASINDLGQNGTTGGGSAAATVVTSIAAFSSAAAGTAAGVIRLSGAIAGTVAVGSNKTIEGAAGAVFTGSLQLENSVNVIVRNLKIVGLNCSDFADCQTGADAVSVNTAHHIWIDHCDISDGSDGNLDITDRSDYVTVSWNKFSYSTSGRIHRYSNIIGGSDTATADMGHLRVTLHDNWWADNVDQRQPRARFGLIHVFNNLYTSTASSYCVGLGFNANILTESNVFIGVRNPINAAEFSNAASVVVSRNNIYQGTTGTTADQGTGVFSPPYPYAAQAASTVEAAVRAGAGPH